MTLPFHLCCLQHTQPLLDWVYSICAVFYSGCPTNLAPPFSGSLNCKFSFTFMIACIFLRAFLKKFQLCHIFSSFIGLLILWNKTLCSLYLAYFIPVNSVHMNNVVTSDITLGCNLDLIFVCFLLYVVVDKSVKSPFLYSCLQIRYTSFIFLSSNFFFCIFMYWSLWWSMPLPAQYLSYYPGIEWQSFL